MTSFINIIGKVDKINVAHIHIKSSGLPNNISRYILNSFNILEHAIL